MQSKEEIITGLQESMGAVVDFIESQPDSAFEVAEEGKWSQGQQLEHLLRSAQPVNLALSFPKFVLEILFGTARRPGRDFAGVISRYTEALEAGGKASGLFVPPKQVAASRKAGLLHAYRNEIEKFEKTVPKWSDADLDRCVLPHPLIGKLTLREMLFFTIYHNRRHLESMQRAARETAAA